MVAKDGRCGRDRRDGPMGAELGWCHSEVWPKNLLPFGGRRLIEVRIILLKG